jgi:hypothetical protein
MPRVDYALPMQGFRPRTNPSGALGRYGLRGLGDSNTFSGCVSAIDGQGNPVSCSDPNAAVWFDANMNAAPPGTPASGSASTPSGGAPTGSLLRYQGTFQVSPTLNVNTIVSQVSAAVRSYGLQVVDQQNSGGALTIGNFNVQLTLQVIGSGFANPSDAGSIVDHAYYTVTGHMPVFSSTVLQSAPGTPIPSLVPTPPGSSPAVAPPTTFTAWLEQNAMWVGLGVVAIVVLPVVAKKVL